MSGSVSRPAPRYLPTFPFTGGATFRIQTGRATALAVEGAEPDVRVMLVELSPAGGLYHYALHLAEGMARAGHQVALVTGGHPEMLPEEPGVLLRPVLPTWDPTPRGELSTLRRQGRRVLRAGLRARAWCLVSRQAARLRPDVVQLGNLQFSLDAFGALALCRRAWRVAVLAHTPRPLGWRRRGNGVHNTGILLRLSLGAAYRAVSVALVLGERSREELQATFPGVDRVAVVPHGAGGRLVAATPVPAGQAPPRVLFFGTWARYKGLDVLLDAFEMLRRDVPEAELLLAGAVAKDVDLAAVRRRCSGLGGVVLRPGYVPAADVPGLIGGARVLVAPYLTANQSGVIHLAQSLARPVVASRVGDLPDVVLDEVNGLLVPPADAAALAAALCRLLRDPGLASRLGEDGRSRAATTSWDDAAAAVIAVYEELVQSSGSPVR